MRRIILYISLCLPLMGAAQVLTEAQIRDFKAQAIAKNKAIETMQADFVQKKHLDFMSKDIET